MPTGSTKYDPGIHTQLAYWMARGGLTLPQIAEQLGVSEKTIDTWKRKHPEFADAMKPGKEYADFLVQGSLLKRAMGYSVVEVTRERVAVEFDGIIPIRWKMQVTKKVTKHIPADPAAMIFWLKNRQGWRDRTDINHTGSIEHRQDLSRLSDEELATFRGLAEKLEAPVAGRN